MDRSIAIHALKINLNNFNDYTTEHMLDNIMYGKRLSMFSTRAK